MTFVIVLISILSFKLFIYSVLLMIENRNQVTLMEAKSIAMSTGMVFGLISGLYMMYVLSDEISSATFISMAIGSLAGLTLSAPIHVLAVMEGLMAGIMGGMMGVMLGAMLPVSDWDLMMKVLMLIMVIVLSINVSYLYKKSSKKYPTNLRFFMLFTIILLYAGVIFNLISTGPVIQIENVPTPHNEHGN
ncbi:hypothetical protein [Bacillus sp. Marseille-Q3570]|uniref:hypothetical protein n=1 Tax=Bacillus sp. Marseille-Q3570 TaxID=2963522 RepID=UPI0021B782A5|nr:hypothetical protein [Bacillus sp. Marseille-Q3570]